MVDIANVAEQNFELFFCGALAWVAFWILVSVAYRIWRKKPLFAQTAHNAVFAESWASGQSNKNVLSKLGGARNCLHVALTPSELQIQPHFPATLLFLPEIFDLELRIPRSHIRAVVPERKFLNDALLISFGAPGEAVRSVHLMLRRQQEFLNALGQ